MVIIDMTHVVSENPPAWLDCPVRAWSLLDLIRFYGASFANLVGQIERAWHALAIAAHGGTLHSDWTIDAAWKEVDLALEQAQRVLVHHDFPSALIRQANRVAKRCENRIPQNIGPVVAALQELNASIYDELSTRVYVMLAPSENENFKNPSARFGDAVAKFPDAAPSMESASRCYALDEWDAAVFHSMRVLEHGLRWLAAQINAGPFPLTLNKPVELEQWGTIIGNIQARIDDELGPPKQGHPPRPQKTAEREKELAFYSKAAKEFMYFKEAWRNYVMHDKGVPFGAGTALSVLDHVSSFMKILAERA